MGSGPLIGGSMKSAIYLKTIVIFCMCPLLYSATLSQVPAGDSQIVTAFQAKLIFVGKVIAIGPRIEGFLVGPSAQTVIFKVKMVLKGRLQLSYISVSVGTSKDLREVFSDGDEIIVFLNKFSGHGRIKDCGDSKGLSKADPAIDQSKNFLHAQCYKLDSLRSFIYANAEEIKALKFFLNRPISKRRTRKELGRHMLLGRSHIRDPSR
jgi:hypothetical protein